MFPQKGRTWAVIKVPYHTSPSLVQIEQTGDGFSTVHWGGGPTHMSHCVEGKSYSVLHLFPDAPLDKFGEVDTVALELEMHRLSLRSRVFQENSPKAGFPPEGEFYMCEYGEHDALAERITGSKMQNVRGAKVLEEQNWLRVCEDGTIFRGDYYKPYTQAQINTLFDLSHVGRIGWRERIKETLQDASLDGIT